MKKLIDMFNSNLLRELKDENKEWAQKQPTTLNEMFKHAYAMDTYYNGENSTFYRLFSIKEDYNFKLYYDELTDTLLVKMELSFYDMNLVKFESDTRDFIEIGEL